MLAPLHAQMNEGALLGSKHSLSVGRCIKWRIARCYDADALLKVSAASNAASPLLLSSSYRSSPAMRMFGGGWQS